jgi:hypothetical protein
MQGADTVGITVENIELADRRGHCGYRGTKRLWTARIEVVRVLTSRSLANCKDRFDRPDLC